MAVVASHTVSHISSVYKVLIGAKTNQTKPDKHLGGKVKCLSCMAVVCQTIYPGMATMPRRGTPGFHRHAEIACSKCGGV